MKVTKALVQKQRCSHNILMNEMVYMVQMILHYCIIFMVEASVLSLWMFPTVNRVYWSSLCHCRYIQQRMWKMHSFVHSFSHWQFVMFSINHTDWKTHNQLSSYFTSQFLSCSVCITSNLMSSCQSMSVFYCQTWIWFDWLIAFLPELPFVLFHMRICHVLWDYGDETMKSINSLISWCFGTWTDLSAFVPGEIWPGEAHGTTEGGQCTDARDPQNLESWFWLRSGSIKSRWSYTRKLLEYCENDNTKHDHGSSSILEWCFDFENRRWIHVGSHFLSFLVSKAVRMQ